MSRRSIIVCAALALAACERDAPGNQQTPAAEAQRNADVATSATGKPSFDCARADGQAQQLICSDSELAAIDRELDRLHRLVEGGASEVEARSGWNRARDECWKADDLRQCVAEAYAARIHAVRLGNAERLGTGGGLSVGPIAFDCGSERLAVTFVNSEPGLVHLSERERVVTLPRAPSASGARYAGRVDGEAWEFWNKGNDATLTRPGGTVQACSAAASG